MDTKKEELVGGLTNLTLEVCSKGQSEEQVVQGVAEDSKLKEIEKQIKELKEKIEKSDGKTSLKTYADYEKKVKGLAEKLDKLKIKEEEIKNGLKGLKENLKKKKDEREKALEEAKDKLKNFKNQVGSAGGQTYGHQVQNRGGIGLQAWNCVNKLGLNGNYSRDTSNSDQLANKVIEDALTKIEEELREIVEKNKE
ncbi:ErpL protein (plasmid) [Borrelia maritima]|uniref:ErpL protein n=1 Tax=Borrelia maritima TaxID=2761123 RepID=A0A5J6WE59_9SPIR|nr:ErpL protein [Borrelia maritima]QFI15087.1 ErpL protein [Borrelia maritima]